MSVKKISQIAADLQSGAATLDFNTAVQISKTIGKRFSKQEQAALLTLEKGVENNTIKMNELGKHAFLDILMQKPVSRISKGVEEAGTWGSRAGAVATAIAAASGAVAGAMAGASFGVSAQGAGMGALAGLGAGRILGTVFGFFKGIIED